MRVLRSSIVVFLMTAFIVATGGTLAHAGTGHVWPVDGPVVRGFDPPATHYGTGHRGIDIAAAEGSPVVAAADGVVTFVGVIDHVGVMTVTHNDVRTTYQPVTATAHVGDVVVAGQQIGLLLPGHGVTTSLHFGVLRGNEYLDPLMWLGATPTPVRLLPDGTVVPPRAASVATVSPGTAGQWPVSGPVTSGYGWRVHPILGTLAFHDGIDIAAPCGTPVATPWAGTVSAAARSATLGNYVIVAHADGLTTTYGHLSAFSVTAGDRLAGGQQIGLVGTTGLSTGCHLHFATARNGTGFDPRTVLP